MKKLLKLKEWLTLPDAAKHLSIIFDEDVSEADVLRLALDGQLQLSVYFVNQATARRGNTVPLSEAKTEPGIPFGLDGKPFEPDEVIRGLRIFIKHPDGQVEEKVVQFSKEIIHIDGVWDLPMLGGERLDIEYKYQMLTNGVKVTDVTLDGSFVRNMEGEIWAIQSSFDDSVLVVRTEALRNLEQKGTEVPEQGTEKILSTTERNTLLKVIGVMAKKGYGHDLSKPYEAAGEIEKDAEELGIKICNDTIANKLKEAKKIMEDKQE